jgi:CRISPR-associated protein Cas1
VAILYVTEQGAALLKRGNRLVVEKLGKTVQWVHAFKVEQVVLMGAVSLSPGAVAFLLQEGIDTVFLSMYGKYRGRLISQFGKNIDLRRLQFQKLAEPEFCLGMARAAVQGKLHNCRVLLRRQNQELGREEITRAIHQLRRLARQAGGCETAESLLGVEGAGAAAYFGVFKYLLRVEDIRFDGRNRRPPRDPVNVLLSLGYTLLANAVQTQVHIAGLDPYLGCLHRPEYGRPSLVLDLMEEFRPVLVDLLVLTVINRRIIRATDFYRPEEQEPAAFDFAAEEPVKEGYPILLTHQGMKKFIAQFEGRLQQKTLHVPRGQRLSYRDICLEQVRLWVRHLQGEAPYSSFTLR